MNICTHETYAPRAQVGALTVVACLATFRIGTLIAQAIPTDPSMAAACGAGRQLECGLETIKRCQEADLPTPLNFGRMGGYRFQQPPECEVISQRRLYKDGSA